MPNVKVKVIKACEHEIKTPQEMRDERRIKDITSADEAFKSNPFNVGPYCEKCGAKLVLENRPWGHSNTTGRPMVFQYGVCPNQSWFDKQFGGRHTEAHWRLEEVPE